MRIVFINSIYPNPVEPTKGNFVLKNLMHYPADVEVEVIAPVPFFLSLRRRKCKVLPFVRHEEMGERKIRVWHPRFPLLPRNILRAWVPGWEYRCILPLLFGLHKFKRIDVLHANFCLPDGIATAKLARRLRLPFVITEHQGILAELLSKGYLSKMMLPAYANAHRVIAVSEQTRELLIDAGAREDNLVVIPNGIDNQLFVATARQSTIKKLIFIGNLVELKGVQILLKALASLQDPTLSLSLVGEGIYRKELEKLCLTLGLSKQVQFWGEQSPSEVAKMLHQHDALIHPSFIESFGIVVVEAMASGLPVLATINGGSEYILSPQTGILVPSRDVEAMAAGIRQLIGSNWDNAAISAYARAKYDIKQVVQRTIKQYPSPQYKVCHLSSVHIRTDVRVFYKQCVALARHGFKMHLLIADGKGNELRQGVRIHDVGLASGRKQRMLWAPLKLFSKANSLKADLYQIHDPELIPMAMLLKAITGKPVIYDIHECYPEMFLHKDYLAVWQGKLISSFIKILEQMAVRYFDAAIAATEHIAEQFEAVPILHNYPLLSEWQNAPESPQRYASRNICYLGSITKERGLSQLVKALEYVDCSLHLAGSFEPASYRDELANLPGFAKVVEYGYVNRGEALQLLAKCAIGVVFFDRSPNHLYSLSTKMFEYMASGLPLIVSDLPANVKLLDRVGCGRYLDPSQPENIAQAIAEMLSDPERLRIMGAKGKSMIGSELSWEAEEPAFLKLYSSLLPMEKE